MPTANASGVRSRLYLVPLELFALGMSSVCEELDRDLAILAAVEAGGPPSFRTWRTDEATVVVGRSVRIPEEVETDTCLRLGIPIVRRPSGGRSVLVGPGTLQYTFTLPYALDPRLRSIPASKRYCNELLLAALEPYGNIHADVSGDLVLDERKIAGLALKCRRNALMLHGTLLLACDLRLVARVLKHPIREPDYRHGRAHGEFLKNLGPLDEDRLRATVTDCLRSRIET